MTMFWIIAGVALAVVLVGAWLYDRRWTFDPDRRKEIDRAQSEVDTAWGRDRTYGGGF